MPYKSKFYYLNTKKINSKIFADSKKLQKLLKLAKSGKYSARDLSNRFNCNNAAIRSRLYSEGIILQNLGRFVKRVYCKDNFFNKLNKNSAYWAGFIAADGNLFQKYRSISIGLSWKDLNHLKKFKKALKTNAKISLIKSNKSARICIGSNKLYHDLEIKGIKANKSLSISKVNIPVNLMNHFVRGVYDGDGSISGRDRYHLQLCIVGNEPFLEYLQIFLVKKLNLNKVKIYHLTRCKAKRLQYTGIQSLKILDFLYKNSNKNIRLERKYKKYINLKKKYTL